jgi:hypothetical protein
MRIAIGFAAGTLALLLATIWWAVASDREVWREITADTVLLRELEYPKAGATVAGLGRRVKQAHPEAASYGEVDLGRAMKARFPGRYGAYADVPDETDPVTLLETGLTPGTPLWTLLFEE